ERRRRRALRAVAAGARDRPGLGRVVDRSLRTWAEAGHGCAPGTDGARLVGAGARPDRAVHRAVEHRLGPGCGTSRLPARHTPARPRGRRSPTRRPALPGEPRGVAAAALALAACLASWAPCEAAVGPPPGSGRQGAGHSKPDVLDREGRVAAAAHASPDTPLVVGPPAATQHAVLAVHLRVVALLAP